MTKRDREDAVAMVKKFTASFSTDAKEGSVIPTQELTQMITKGQSVVFVDVRDSAEQETSMIPGAISKDLFERTLLPELKGLTPDEALLVVPYCTVGYRSGLYSRSLIKDHGLSNVRNGEGVIMWTFDGGRLVRPSSDPSRGGTMAPALAPENPLTAREVMRKFVDSNDEEGSSALLSRPEVTSQVHVYGKPWDCANDGFTTIYFSSSEGAWKIVSTTFENPRTFKFAAWAFVFFLFYLFFTPACGVMYDCGCRLGLSKWGQVSACNIFDNTKDDCPWCSCQGISCVLVATDTRTFKGFFLLDLWPDGTVLSVWTFLALRPIFSLVDRSKRFGNWGGLGLKAIFATIWFLLYCLTMGAFFFFVVDPSYPYFLGFERSLKGSIIASSSTCPSGYCDGSYDLFINASFLNDHLDDWVILDARTFAEAEAGGIVKGAILAPWQQLSQGGDPAEGRKSILRPSLEIQTLLAIAGLDGTRPVAVYGSWNNGWGEEGRLYWTLKYLGVAPRVACLHGGVAAWQKQGFTLEAPIAGTNTLPDVLPSVVPGNLPTLHIDPLLRATTELVEYMTQTGDAIILDVRERSEYDGLPTGDPYGAARSGHVPTARFWNWKNELFESGGSSSTLKHCEDILDSLPIGAEAKDVVAYCTGGIRSGFTFMLLHACGLDHSRNFDGSWWAWASDEVLPCTGEGPGCSGSDEDDDDAAVGGNGGSGR